MKHTEAEIEDAARRFDRLAELLDPAATVADDISRSASHRRSGRPGSPGRRHDD
jgi:hypothetical protein